MMGILRIIRDALMTDQEKPMDGTVQVEMQLRMMFALSNAMMDISQLVNNEKMEMLSV